MPESDVTLYALSTCVHCKNARKYLDECGTDYECIYVDKLQGDERKAMIDEVRKHNPSLSFPTIRIGDKVVVGFRKDELKELLGQ